MSPGKQGLILLELLLHLNSADYPILIDQPEDNLDNRAIYTRLVKFLRDKKKNRQIILVTHNPNLVVGADAEEVIVANQSGESRGENRRYRFEYVSGSLECSFRDETETAILYSRGIREHVCEVLEGGVEAFKEREEKYCLE
jgi:ABC-type cobalamin/Fe3+-siderophores transport system ATPase subunit